MQRLELFFKIQVSCPNMAILIITLYFGNGPKLLASVVLPLIYTRNWHADLEFACKFCFLVFMFFLGALNNHEERKRILFPKSTGPNFLKTSKSEL